MHFLITLLAVSCICAQFVIQASNVVEMEAQPQSTEDKLIQNVLKGLLHKDTQNEQAQLAAFSWNDCGGTHAEVSELSLQPDPVVLPGDLIVSAKFNVSQALKAPLQTKLDVYKKEFGVFIEIPCIDDIGSCTYKNICKLLEELPASDCPASLTSIDIDCKCPVAENSYNLETTRFYVALDLIPHGEYKIKAMLYQEEDQNEEEAICLELYLSLTGS